MTRAARAATDTWLAAAADDDKRGADAGTRELDSGAAGEVVDDDNDEAGGVGDVDGDVDGDDAAIVDAGVTTSVDRSGGDKAAACTTGSMLSTQRAKARLTCIVARASSSSRRSL